MPGFRRQGAVEEYHRTRDITYHKITKPLQKHVLSLREPVGYMQKQLKAKGKGDQSIELSFPSHGVR